MVPIRLTRVGFLTQEPSGGEPLTQRGVVEVARVAFRGGSAESGSSRSRRRELRDDDDERIDERIDERSQ